MYLKFRCDKCGTEFEARMYVKCPQCGEMMHVHPIYDHRYKDMQVHTHKG